MSEVTVIDKDPELLWKLKVHTKSITDLVFHPNLDYLASSSEDSSVMVWNFKSINNRCMKFTDHTDKVTCVDISACGKLLASGSDDKTICMGAIASNRKATSFHAHSAGVSCIQFSRTDNKLVSGSQDKTIKVWDIEKQTPVVQFLEHTNSINCVKYTCDNKMLISSSKDFTLKMWDANSGQLIHSFPPTKAVGNSLSIHPGNNLVAVGMSSGSVRVYDIRTLKIQQHYILHDNTKSVAWHPLANFLVTCGNDGSVRLVDVLEGRPLYTLNSCSEAKECVAFSKDGTYFASGGANKLFEVWKTNFIVLKGEEEN